MLSLGTILQAQTISSDKVWTMSYRQSYPGYPESVNYENSKLMGETTIDGMKFMEYFSCPFNPDDGTEGELKSSHWFYAEQDDKVYMHIDGFETTTVMDFSLQPGDIFTDSRGSEFTVIAVSDTVFETSTDKVPRKCLYIAYKDRQEIVDIWVKGIGSLYFGLLGIDGLNWSGSAPGLQRCVAGDVVLYDNSYVSQEYYPEGTRWTEIRLDTLQYDSWYSKVGDEWVPNYETIEYYMKGEYTDKYGNTYQCVYTNGPEWMDSLTLMIQEADNSVRVSVLWHENSRVLFPGTAYQFDWSVGKGLYYEDILYSNAPGIESYYCYYGIIDEIKEGDFGGVRPLRYVDLDGKAPENTGSIIRIATNGGRIIQGIGITEWNDGECLFGPPCPYAALQEYEGYEQHPERHYRSMLVHFERNGEVLYDVWPEKESGNGILSIQGITASDADKLYDLTGRRLSSVPARGLYIQNGKKILKK